MPTARQGLTIDVIDGILYAVGGLGSNGTLNTVEAYDPATDTWTTMASMPTARTSLASGVVNGRLYAVGGMYKSNFLNTVEAFTPR
jgi:N-acetylneuraminic acid mutarotase